MSVPAVGSNKIPFKEPEDGYTLLSVIETFSKLGELNRKNWDIWSNQFKSNLRQVPNAHIYIECGEDGVPESIYDEQFDLTIYNVILNHCKQGGEDGLDRTLCKIGSIKTTAFDLYELLRKDLELERKHRIMLLDIRVMTCRMLGNDVRTFIEELRDIITEGHALGSPISEQVIMYQVRSQLYHHPVYKNIVWNAHQDDDDFEKLANKLIEKQRNHKKYSPAAKTQLNG